MQNSEKIIAIGDIHGCYRTVKALLKKLEPYSRHTLLFIGDYIDRGPSSKEVISLMIDIQKQRKTVFLRGNHEQMLLDAIDKGKTQIWIYNGGNTTLKSYGITSAHLDFPDSHLTFYRSTKLYFQTGNYFFVHAGAPPDQPIEKSLQDPQSVQNFLWGRDHLNVQQTPWKKTVVFGHTPRTELIRRPNMTGIDTGCVYSAPGMGRLTALILPENEVIQQFSLDLV